MVANGALRAEGDGVRSMSVTLTSGGVAMVIDPFLIYGLGMGLDGAALGVVLSRFVMLAMGLRFATGPTALTPRLVQSEAFGFGGVNAVTLVESA